MSMKLKTIALVLALFGFSNYVFAKPVTYAFSSFGGGLPSSATKVLAADSDTPSTQRIIVEEDDDDDIFQEDRSDEPTVKKGKKGAVIATYVVLGVLVTAGIIVGSIYLANESGKCLDDASESCAKGCSQGCSDSSAECGNDLGKSCADSSKNSGSNIKCSSDTIGLAGNGISLIPIYVP